MSYFTTTSRSSKSSKFASKKPAGKKIWDDHDTAHGLPRNGVSVSTSGSSSSSSSTTDSNNPFLPTAPTSTFFSPAPTITTTTTASSLWAVSPDPSSFFSFNPRLLAATPRSLRAAKLWPEGDENMQRLLITIIDIAAEDKSNMILTTPTVIALADCALRLGSYLLTDVIRSNLPAIRITNELMDLTPVVGGSCLQTTIEKFQTGGWAAAVAHMPQSIIENWCQEAKKSCTSVNGWNFPSGDLSREAVRDPSKSSTQYLLALESELQQAILAAVVVEWLRVLLKSIRSAASRLNSPLMSTSIFLESTVDLFSENVAAKCFKQLRCSATVKLESLKLSFGTSSEFLAFDAGSGFSFGSSHQSSGFHFSSGNSQPPDCTFLESEAGCRILESVSWYHSTTLLQRVAQQLVSGERSLHESDKSLYGMDFLFQSLKGERLIPFATSFKHEKKSLKRLYFEVADASGLGWSFAVEMDETGRGELQCSSKGQYEPVASCHPSWTRDITITASQSKILDKFTPHLSSSQQNALEQLEQAIRSCVEEATSTQTQVRSQLGTSKDPSARVAITNTPHGIKGGWDSIRIALMHQWRSLAIEQIAAVAIEFLDYVRWGPQRYADNHTQVARRQFQSFLIDASFQANQIQVLPTAILDIIADYYTIEVLPYITFEEQEALMQQQSVPNMSDDHEELSAILTSM